MLKLIYSHPTNASQLSLMNCRLTIHHARLLLPTLIGNTPLSRQILSRLPPDEMISILYADYLCSNLIPPVSARKQIFITEFHGKMQPIKCMGNIGMPKYCIVLLVTLSNSFLRSDFLDVPSVLANSDQRLERLCCLHLQDECEIRLA